MLSFLVCSCALLSIRAKTLKIRIVQAVQFLTLNTIDLENLVIRQKHIQIKTTDGLSKATCFDKNFVSIVLAYP